ncbi:MAG: FAD-dependent oxidoreductase [Oscillospiraceae bacterium]|jgi:glycine/D-amino acid oxidase-like deaminating enzyme|nr:FAD-dependent oxidoreductase [Oscillospiraceae bacterium]
MEYITEPARRARITNTCDVLVAGGGVAGIAAALAAARGGASVILLEREYTLGGMATLGLVTIYLPLDDGAGRQVVFGIGEELLKLSIAHGAEANYPSAWLDGGTLDERVKNRYVTQFNPHLFALRAEKLLTDAGVTILYGTLAAGAVKREDAITHIITENKSGRGAIAVKSVIDCTGDADVCALAGAKTVKHAKGNALASWYYYYSKGAVALKMFGLADVVPDGGGGLAAAVPDDTSYDNEMVESLDNGFRFSGVDGAELSRAVIAAHQRMYGDIAGARGADDTYVPVTISSIPLVRMSRRLAGVSTPDVDGDRRFVPDSIGMTGDWRRRGPVFEVPFGALYSSDIKNLLAAGRAISVTDALWDVTRVIPPCAVTGEAAGTAAALYIDKEDCDGFASLDIAELQNKLISQGVAIHYERT